MEPSGDSSLIDGVVALCDLFLLDIRKDHLPILGTAHKYISVPNLIQCPVDLSCAAVYPDSFVKFTNTKLRDYTERMLKNNGLSL